MSPIRSFYLYLALFELGIGCHAVTYVPFLMSVGLSLSEVAFVNVVFMITVTMAEVPTGMIADRYGRAWSLKMAATCMSLSAVVFFLSHGIILVCVAEVIAGFGLAFLSGASQAWVADALTRENRSGEQGKVFANVAIIKGIAMTSGGAIAVLVSLINLRVIWLPTIVLCSLATWVAVRYLKGHGEPFERVTMLESVKLSVSLMKQSPALLWSSLVLIVFGGVACFNHFWVPFFEERTGRLGLIPVWIVIYLSCSISGAIVKRLNPDKHRQKHHITVAMLATGLGLVLIPFCGSWLVPILILAMIHELGRGAYQPLNDHFVQSRVASSHRATFGSLQSLLGSLGLAAVPLFIGLSINHMPSTSETISAVWLVVGSIMVALTLILWVFRPRNSH